MDQHYNPQTLEKVAQEQWLSSNSFAVKQDDTRKKFYCLAMFPYPSGQLHMGHVRNYTIADVIARYQRMQGKNVLQPMGWDAFGLPAENAAIKNNIPPAQWTAQNIDYMRTQLQRLGFAYDWDRELATCDPTYYRWEQWFFTRLFEKGLAYKKKAEVNWCETDQTVLANEQVVNGCCWRCDTPVERREIDQWFIKITDYAEQLLADLDKLDQWPEQVRTMQRNWIGRSEGAEVTFDVEGNDITVFTTRPDTLFGATYMVLAPEHPLVAEITTAENKEAVETYVKACASKSDMDRGLDKNKTGVGTGAFAINPVNGKKIPVWIADYVMMGYGSGAIMAVPAHDERDFEFAKKFDIEIKQVVTMAATSGHEAKTNPEAAATVGVGTAINSGFLDGLKTKDAKKKIIHWLVENKKGEKKIQFKLRDWLFSRQRYWGEPFPLLWDKETGQHSGVPESELPLLQPEMEDFKPTGDPRGPLINCTDWINYSDTLQRETNTMPQWAGSCWYYLRYCDPDNTKNFISPEAESYWGNDDGFVDFYVGGKEHAVLHLLYSRFWHKVLNDLGHVKSSEPFKKYFAPGLIMGEDGQKMSKSLGNVVNPDDVVELYGADSLRLYEMFMGPLDQDKPWAMKGVEGVHRFLAKVWRVACSEDAEGKWQLSGKIAEGKNDDLAKITHATIKRVEEAINTLRFNTGISAMMECTNAYTAAKEVPKDLFLTFLKLLSPFAPHLAEEINSALGETELLSEQTWPVLDESLLVESEIQIIVQVNGKLRARLTVPADISKEDLEKAAVTDENVIAHTDEKTVRKVIVIPGKLVNIVAN